MLVRLISVVRIGTGLRLPGELWDLPADEAAELIDGGCAVPVSREALERETR